MPSLTKITGSGSVYASQRYGSADKDSYQNVTNLQHCWKQCVFQVFLGALAEGKIFISCFFFCRKFSGEDLWKYDSLSDLYQTSFKNWKETHVMQSNHLFVNRGFCSCVKSSKNAQGNRRLRNVRMKEGRIFLYRQSVNSRSAQVYGNVQQYR